LPPSTRTSTSTRGSASAHSVHNDIREAVSADGLVVDSFLQGSFARKTMLKPLKDVDIVLLLDPNLRDPLRAPDGPGLAMDAFKPRVRTKFPDALFDQGDEPSGKALRVSLPECAFTVDLVPAFEEEPPRATDALVGAAGDRQPIDPDRGRLGPPSRPSARGRLRGSGGFEWASCAGPRWSRLTAGLPELRGSLAAVPVELLWGGRSRAWRDRWAS
jgi:Nucleotidyltransferase domain